MKNRILKVRSGHYHRPWTGRPCRTPDAPVPYVLLKGHWLEQANFAIGQSITVEIGDKQLVLRVEPR